MARQLVGVMYGTLLFLSFDGVTKVGCGVVIRLSHAVKRVFGAPKFPLRKILVLGDGFVLRRVLRTRTLLMFDFLRGIDHL